LKEEQFEDFAHFNSQTRLAREINDSQAKSSRQSLNVAVIKDHEGKVNKNFAHQLKMVLQPHPLFPTDQDNH
jgi:hypothetical protein